MERPAVGRGYPARRSSAARIPPDSDAAANTAPTIQCSRRVSTVAICVARRLSRLRRRCARRQSGHAQTVSPLSGRVPRERDGRCRRRVDSDRVRRTHGAGRRARSAGFARRRRRAGCARAMGASADPLRPQPRSPVQGHGHDGVLLPDRGRGRPCRQRTGPGCRTFGSRARGRSARGRPAAPHRRRGAPGAAETADPVLVDPRARDLYAQGHRDGAVNIPERELQSRAAIELPHSRPVVVDCRRGSESMCDVAARILQRVGFPDVSVFVSD